MLCDIPGLVVVAQLSVLSHWRSAADLPLLQAVSIDDYRLQSPLVETESRVCHHVKKKDAYSGVCLGCLIGWAGVDVLKY